MPILERGLGSQGLDTIAASLATNETLTIAFADARDARVPWGDGGVSWTVEPETDGNAIAGNVQHSLLPEGDYWSHDPESPFDGPIQGNEEHRIERIRFTNTGANAIVVTLNSGSKFTEDLA